MCDEWYYIFITNESFMICPFKNRASFTFEYDGVTFYREFYNVKKMVDNPQVIISLVSKDKITDYLIENLKPSAGSKEVSVRNLLQGIEFDIQNIDSFLFKEFFR